MSEQKPELIKPSVEKKKPSWRGAAPLIRKLKLQYPELSDAQIARKVGCSQANVHTVLKTFMGKYTEDQLRQYQENRSDVFDALQLRLLGSVTESKLRKSSATSLITGAAILYDKARLERGQATGINVTALIDVAKLIRSQEE